MEELIDLDADVAVLSRSQQCYLAIIGWSASHHDGEDEGITGMNLLALAREGQQILKVMMKEGNKGFFVGRGGQDLPKAIEQTQDYEDHKSSITPVKSEAPDKVAIHHVPDSPDTLKIPETSESSSTPIREGKRVRRSTRLKEAKKRRTETGQASKSIYAEDSESDFEDYININTPKQTKNGSAPEQFHKAEVKLKRYLFAVHSEDDACDNVTQEILATNVVSPLGESLPDIFPDLKDQLICARLAYSPRGHMTFIKDRGVGIWGMDRDYVMTDEAEQWIMAKLEKHGVTPRMQGEDEVYDDWIYYE